MPYETLCRTQNNATRLIEPRRNRSVNNLISQRHVDPAEDGGVDRDVEPNLMTADFAEHRRQALMLLWLERRCHPNLSNHALTLGRSQTHQSLNR